MQLHVRSLAPRHFRSHPSSSRRLALFTVSRSLGEMWRRRSPVAIFVVVGLEGERGSSPKGGKKRGRRRRRERGRERERSTGWLALEGARYISRRGDVEISQTVIRAPGFFFLSFFFFYLFFIFFAFSRHAVARRVIEGEGEGRLRWWGSGMKRQGERRAKRNNVYDRREGFAITCRILRVSPGSLLVFLPPLRFFFSFFSFYSVFVSLFILFFFCFFLFRYVRVSNSIDSSLDSPTYPTAYLRDKLPARRFLHRRWETFLLLKLSRFFFKSWNSGRSLGFMSVGEAGAKWCSKFKIQRKRGCTEKNK